MALIAHWPLDGRLDDVIGGNHFIKKSSVLDYENGGKLGSNIKILTANKEQIESTKPIRIPDDFSISFFVNVKPEFVNSDNTNSANILSTLNHSEFTGFNIGLIHYSSGFNLIIGGGFGDHRSSQILYSNIRMNYNQFYHITLTYTKSKSEFRIYIDGVLDISKKYPKQLVHKPNFSTLTNKWSKTYDSYYQTFNMYDVRVYNNVIESNDIKEIMKCKILHFRFNQIEIPQYNSAVSQTNIIARAGITISNKKQIKSWNFATISGTTTVGDSRKGVFQIPVTSSAPSENKYSIGVDFRLIGDDISNYYIQVVSNNMSGSPEYAPTRIEGDRFMFENMTIVNTFDLCLYAKVDDYRIPDNVQILWRHIQLEPYPNCTPYVESTTGSNYFHDSSDFRNKGMLGGMRFTPPIYNEECKSLTLYNDGSYSSTINNITTDINLGPDILNQPDFEITIMCRMRTKNIAGRGLILGCGYFGGIGIVVEEDKICGYLRTSSEASVYIGAGANVSINNTEFTNISLSYSRITGKLRFYANNIESVQDRSGSFSFSHITRFNVLKRIESSGNGPWLSGNIEISDIQVYRTVLTKEEIDEAFSKKIELTPKGILKSKYTSNESNNLVDLNPPEYSPVSTASYAMYSLESSASKDLLVRASANDSYSRRFTLTKKIPANTKVLITFDTIRSDNIITDVSVEIICFTYIVGDQGVATQSIHRISDPIVKTHTIEIIEGYDINFFRMDVNKQNATMLFRNIQIHTVGKNSYDVFNRELKLDQISYRKYLPQTNLIDYTTWELNTKGPTGNFNQNGGVNDDNKRMVKLNPWNKFDIVWASEFNDPGSDADGGFNYSQIVNVDYTKKYRYSIWIRTENTGEGSGGVYFGPSNTGTEESTIIEFTDGRELLNTNPYWYGKRGIKLPKSDEWLLLIAYIYPESTTGTATDDAGIYDINGNLVHAITPKFKNSIMVTKAMMRSYLYYSTKVDERCYWYRPRIDLCDGTEPTIDDLLKGREHGSIVEALGKFNPTFPPDEQFLEIKRAHGARWGKIFYHNNKAGTVLFSNDINEFLRCNTEDKKSILYALPYMRDKDYKFEFLLEYDSFEGYNRWKQTSVFTEENIAGYEAIDISWDGNYWGGLEPNTIPTNSWVDGAVGSDNYRYALGARVNFNNAIPGPGISGSSANMNEAKGVHLWVRLPEVAFITPDNTLVVNDIECP